MDGFIHDFGLASRDLSCI